VQYFFELLGPILDTLAQSTVRLVAWSQYGYFKQV
jgi:hypothetical protein